MSSTDNKCPHDIGLTPEEEEGITWLQHMLNTTAASCSPHAKKAHAAHKAVGKLFDKAHELHSYAHQKEAEVAQAELLITGMVGVPHTTGTVKDEDFN